MTDWPRFPLDQLGSWGWGPSRVAGAVSWLRGPALGPVGSVSHAPWGPSSLRQAHARAVCAQALLLQRKKLLKCLR